MSTSTTSTAPRVSSVQPDEPVTGTRLQYTFRSKTLIQTQTGPKYGKDDTYPTYEAALANDCKLVEYSKDGTLVAYVHTTFVEVYRTNGDKARICKIDRSNVVYISFSPANTFLLTWERFGESNGNADNLIVWDVATGALQFKTTQKHCNAEQWPLIRWTDDEIIAGRLVQNELHFFNGRNIGMFAKKLKLPEIATFDFAPMDSTSASRNAYKFAVFVPEHKGSLPGMCRIYTYPNMEHDAHVSFYKANDASVLWNKRGDAVLIHTSTDTDKTGKSYYGETGLWFLSIDGTSFSLGIKGPIHDVKWTPNGEMFVVCYGNPFNTTMFNLKGAPVVDFGTQPRNTIRFSPNGKLLCLGGFGNLQGDMDIWDLTKYKRVSTSQSHCAVYTEWAPDGVHFMTAVLSPRIRVDNGVKIIKYDGSVVYKQDIPELYQAFWRPFDPTLFPEQPIVYPPASVLKQTSSPPQKYTPPSMRALQKPETPAPESKDNNPPGFKIHIPIAVQSPFATSPTNSKRSVGSNQTSSPAQTATPVNQTAEEKRIINLEKRLKEISLLKKKRDDGEALAPASEEKIKNEQKLIDELASLKLTTSKQ